MENVVAGQGNGAIPGHTTDWVSRTDPHFPCNAMLDDHYVQRECYKMQTSWMLTIFGHDFSKAAKACEHATEGFVGTCYVSYGRDAAGHTLRNPEKIIALCDQIPQKERYHQQCIYGGVNVIIDFWGEKLEGQASKLCSLLENDHDKSRCYQTIAHRAPELFNEQSKITAICQTFEEEYKNLCR